MGGRMSHVWLGVGGKLEWQSDAGRRTFEIVPGCTQFERNTLQIGVSETCKIACSDPLHFTHTHHAHPRRKVLGCFDRRRIQQFHCLSPSTTSAMRFSLQSDTRPVQPSPSSPEGLESQQKCMEVARKIDLHLRRRHSEARPGESSRCQCESYANASSWHCICGAISSCSVACGRRL